MSSLFSLYVFFADADVYEPSYIDSKSPRKQLTVIQMHYNTCNRYDITPIRAINMIDANAIIDIVGVFNLKMCTFNWLTSNMSNEQLKSIV